MGKESVSNGRCAETNNDTSFFELHIAGNLLGKSVAQNVALIKYILLFFSPEFTVCECAFRLFELTVANRHFIIKPIWTVF